jgi:hypothetical protein
MECDHCKNTFKTLFSLNYHKQNALFCSSIESNVNFKCIFNIDSINEQNIDLIDKKLKEQKNNYEQTIKNLKTLPIRKSHCMQHYEKNVKLIKKERRYTM